MGELVKLKIIAYKDQGYSQKAGKEFDVLINPSSYSHTFGINYKENESMGDASGSQKFDKYPSENISFKVVLDGTGVVPVNGVRKSVYDMVTTLKDTVYTFNGSIHEPNYVQVVWGGMLFNGRLTSLRVDYNLFKPDGFPLRATIDLDFKGFTSKELSTRKANANSPDLSHLITFHAGDTLPNLCFQIYKNSNYCLEIAKINKLNSFRDIKLGTQLLFPPLINYDR
jgi:hypothetical protein